MYSFFRSLLLSAIVYTLEYRHQQLHHSLRLSEVTIEIFFSGFTDYNCVKKGMLKPMTLVDGCHSELDPFKLIRMKSLLTMTILATMATTGLVSNWIGSFLKFCCERQCVLTTRILDTCCAAAVYRTWVTWLSCYLTKADWGNWLSGYYKGVTILEIFVIFVDRHITSLSCCGLLDRWDITFWY